MANGTLSAVSEASLSANTTISNVTESAASTFGAIGDAAGDADSKLKNAVQRLRSAGFDGKFGINPLKVEDMKKAIGSYVDKLLDDEHLGGLKSVKASTAFGETIGASIEHFTSKVYDSVRILTENLNAFQKDLDQVKAAYEAKATNLSSTVTDTGNDLGTTASSWSYSSGSGSN